MLLKQVKNGATKIIILGLLLGGQCGVEKIHLSALRRSLFAFSKDLVTLGLGYSFQINCASKGNSFHTSAGMCGTDSLEV